MKLYLIGSLRNPRIPAIGNALRQYTDYDVFDDWFAGGEIADDAWQAYETTRGRRMDEALVGYAAQHVYQFDKYHLDAASVAVLVAPAGKSSHLELGMIIGSGRQGYVLFEESPDRWDVMYNLATGVFFSLQKLISYLGPQQAEPLEDKGLFIQEHRTGVSPIPHAMHVEGHSLDDHFHQYGIHHHSDEV